jgi:glycosyltransferase involved in cell wall biosynthesis
MNKIPVTVLMPVYNAEHFLNKAIDSILNQTFTDFEFIIINDGSTDRSEEIIKSYSNPRIRYYKNASNLKLIATLNKGFDLANGKYIARMDADDISLPTRLKLQYELMENDDTVGLCGTWFDTFNRDKIVNTSRYGPDHATICFKHLYQIHLSHGTCMFRTSVLKQHSLYFNPDFSHAEDYELWSRISMVTKLANVQQVLYKVRQHENEVSHRYSDIQKANSYRVKTKLFAAMGIPVTHQELDLLRDIAYQNYEHSDAWLLQSKTLLEKLLSAKNYDMFFSKAFYENKVAEFWLNVNYNMTAHKGVNAYNHYHASPISTLKPLGLSTKAKFIFKGLLKK